MSRAAYVGETFTDKELKVLQEALDARFCASVGPRTVRAVLNRLYAAELCASQFAASFPEHAATNAWRKAAGK